jgi:hypothetical protein
MIVPTIDTILPEQVSSALHSQHRLVPAACCSQWQVNGTRCYRACIVGHFASSLKVVYPKAHLLLKRTCLHRPPVTDINGQMQHMTWITT